MNRRMKKIGTWLIASVFVAAAVFSFIGMGHTNTHDGTTGCVASAARGVTCPLNNSSQPTNTFHLDAYQGFSLVTFSDPQIYQQENILGSKLAPSALFGLIFGLTFSGVMNASGLHRLRKHFWFLVEKLTHEVELNWLNQKDRQDFAS